MTRRLLPVLMILVAFSCTAGAVYAQDESAERAPEVLLHHYQELVFLLQRTEEDCDAMAVGLADYSETHGAAIDAAAGEISELAAADRGAVLRKHLVKWDKLTDGFIHGLRKCADHGEARELGLSFNDRLHRSEDVPAPPDDDRVSSLLRYLDRIGRIIGADDQECPKIGRKLTKYAASNGVEVRELLLMLEAIPRAHRLRFELDHKTIFEDALNRIVDGSLRCGRDEAVEGALADLGF